MSPSGTSGRREMLVISGTRRWMLWAVLVAASAAASLGLGAAPAAAGTLDQQQTNFVPNAISFGGQRQFAQVFTAGLSGNLDQVDVYIRRNSSCNGGSGITAQIRTLTGSTPSNTALATKTIPAASIIATSPLWLSFTFEAPAPVTAGTQYALVLSAPDAGSCPPMQQPYDWRGALGNPYDGGASYFTNDGGSSWTIQSMGDFDTAFKTYVAEPPPPEPPPPTPTPPTAACGGNQATVVGTGAGETLTGTPGRDVIAGLGGRDTLRGLAGNDVLCGGRGRDTLKGGGGNDKLLGGAGLDRLLGGTGPDRCNGGPGNDDARACKFEANL
jgi:Ca2+-binding RTX toxin-like protein